MRVAARDGDVVAADGSSVLHFQHRKATIISRCGTGTTGLHDSDNAWLTTAATMVDFG